jgi:hypothetical protein
MYLPLGNTAELASGSRSASVLSDNGGDINGWSEPSRESTFAIRLPRIVEAPKTVQ